MQKQTDSLVGEDTDQGIGGIAVDFETDGEFLPTPEKDDQTEVFSGGGVGGEMNQEQQGDLFPVLSEKTEEEPLSEWQLEYGKHLLTKFDKEKSKEMTVEEWCSATLRILNSFSGTKMLKLISMMDSVEIEGWEKDKMVLWKYDEKSLSEFIIQKWHQVYGRRKITIQLRKRPGETYQEFLKRLQQWIFQSGLIPTPEWYIIHLEASAPPGVRMLAKDETDPSKWASIVDSALRDSKKDDSETDKRSERMSSDSDQGYVPHKNEHKRFDYRQRDYGRDRRVPVCFCCGGVGHVKSVCPLNKERKY